MKYIFLPPEPSIIYFDFTDLGLFVHCLDFKSQGVIIWLVNLRMAKYGFTLIFGWLIGWLVVFCSLFLIENLSSGRKIFLRGRKTHVWHLETWKLLLSANGVPSKLLGAQKRLSLTLIKNHKTINLWKIPLRSLNSNIFLHNLQDRGTLYVTASERDLFLHFTSTTTSCTSKSG